MENTCKYILKRIEQHCIIIHMSHFKRMYTTYSHMSDKSVFISVDILIEFPTVVNK